MNLLTLASAAAVVVGAASPAFAQDYPANTAASPGVPGYAAVNRAPGATAPYLHDGRTDFYHPMTRERALQAKVQAALASGQLNKSQAATADQALHRVVLEDRTQIARHGHLRDWDRERLNFMMNHLVDRFGALKS